MGRPMSKKTPRRPVMRISQKAWEVIRRKCQEERKTAAELMDELLAGRHLEVVSEGSAADLSVARELSELAAKNRPADPQAAKKETENGSTERQRQDGSAHSGDELPGKPDSPEPDFPGRRGWLDGIFVWDDPGED